MPNRKDSVSLVCDIGELAGLFDRTRNLDDFLKNVVSTVAYHMRAAVCSVYLYDEAAQRLVLKANQGLDAAEGVVRLKLGEGLVGLALRELRPVRESNALRSPLFRLVPGINEERYRSFLAVPILRGHARVGVLVVQDPVEDYFDENDTKALRAIAAQLAATIENFNLIMGLRAAQEPPAPQERRAETARFLKGLAAAPGWAIGSAFFLERAVEEAAGEDDASAGDFDRSVRRTEAQLLQLQQRAEEEFTDVASMIFSAHLLILKDPLFSGEIARRIAGGSRPREAIYAVVNHYVALFAASPNPRMREKVDDVRDLGHRLLQNLADGADGDAADYKGRIIVTREILPSEIVKLAAQQAEGLVVVGGGVTAHVSILARSLQVPAVGVEDETLLALPAGSRLLLDGNQGNLVVEPGEEVVRSFEELAGSRRAAETFVAPGGEGAATRDGQRVRILANINLLSEVALAARMNVAGIGLYRSEFPFIVRNNFPSEEEQVRIYGKILSGMPGKPVVFRTLDVGGDKMLSYFPMDESPNPFLGLRALRFSLRHRSIFTEQLRALLRAGAGQELSILFPLVSSVDDLLEARRVAAACAETLAAEGVPHAAAPRIGAMIEVPSAVEVVEELAEACDFLSIGSNDLVQYMLAVDRTNQQVSAFYQAHHPAVLRALDRVAKAAAAAGKPLSLCGEAACDPRMLPFLIGVGIRTFSVDVRLVPALYALISKIDATAAAAAAQRVLRLGLISEIEKVLGAVSAG